MTEETEVEQQELPDEYKADERLLYLDKTLILSAQRDIFDEKEIYEIVERLSELDMRHPELTVPVVDRSRERVYTGADIVMSMLLDVRNIEYPYPELRTEEENGNSNED